MSCFCFLVPSESSRGHRVGSFKHLFLFFFAVVADISRSLIFVFSFLSHSNPKAIKPHKTNNKGNASGCGIRRRGFRSGMKVN